MREKLPNKVQDFVDKYFNLELNGRKVRCPYYINIKKLKQKMGLRVLVGKGTPEEIIQESLVYEKLRGVDFTSMTKDEIRKFMVKRHIGIDCSGFISHVLDFWLRESDKKRLWKYLIFPKLSLYGKIAIFLRPVQNISAKMLTNDENTFRVSNLNNVRVGDVIRARMKSKKRKGVFFYHVMLISEVLREKGKVLSFKYVHSTRYYMENHGVRVGEVIINDPRKSLCFQKWTDEIDGINWTKDEICFDKEYSQIRKYKNLPLYDKDT